VDLKNLVKILLAFVLVFSIVLLLASPTAEAKHTSCLMSIKNVYTYQYENGTKYYLEFWKKEYGCYKWSNSDFGTAFKEMYN